MKKILIALVATSIIAVSFFDDGSRFDLFFRNDHTQQLSMTTGTVILCSGEKLDLGRCTGSAYCSACKTCNYCAYCNSGGTCGVCDNRETRVTLRRTIPSTSEIHTIPGEKKEEPKSNHRVNTGKSKKSKDLIYEVIKATSLRKAPDSRSSVLKRLSIGDKVTVIDCSNEYWCKVIYRHTQGWIKKHLITYANP